MERPTGFDRVGRVFATDAGLKDFKTYALPVQISGRMHHNQVGF